jgi:mannose-6-phosphate isomerase-like protein (cupin superfamily)
VTPELDPARLFPAGTAVSRLTVYDWEGPGGVRGGSAHVHLACTEGYVVLAGHGVLQTLGPDGYAETELAPMTVAWFSPGVIHRLVNTGRLQILVVMQNGGLPEAGDCVLTFPPDVLADAGAYAAAATLADPIVPPAAAADGGDKPGSGAAAARRRKDLAVEGFLRLRDQVAEHGPGVLEEFYATAAALVRPALPGWRERWEAGPLAAALATGEHLDQLDGGHHDHLRQGRLTVLGPPEDRRYGNCGRLDAYPPYPPGQTRPGEP